MPLAIGQRTADGFQLHPMFGNIPATLSVSAGTSELEFSYTTGGVYQTDSLTLPFNFAGDIYQNPVNPVQFLVSGFDQGSNTGFILGVLVVPGPSPLLLVEHTTTLPGRDPAEILFNPVEGRTYFIDGNDGGLYVASGFTPSAFVQAVNPATCGGLTAFSGQEVDLELPASGAGVRLISRMSEIFYEPDYLVFESGSTWVSQLVVPPQASGFKLIWGLNDPVGHAIPLQIHGPPSGAFEIVTLAGTVVYSGFLTAANTLWQEHALPTNTLAPGGRYLIRGTGAGLTHSPSEPFLVQHRWGAGSLQSGVRVGRVRFNPNDAVDSALNFAVSSLLREEGTAVSGDITVSLNIGVYQPGVNPTVSFGGELLLANPLASLPTKSWSLNADTREAAFVFELPLTGGAGVVPLFQIAGLLSDGSVVVSDIAGVEILGSVSALTSQEQPPPGSGAARRSPSTSSFTTLLGRLSSPNGEALCQTCYERLSR